jgi:putative spermidine/putrescine transport system ATP-binding protein
LVDLVKAYPHAPHPAVDTVNLNIAAGEFMTFLGPSGSGKTTTLNMIAGFTHATSGEILLDGASVGDVPPYRRDIGMVFQQYALFPHLTAARNIAFPLERRKVPKAVIAARVAEALKLVRLEGLGDRFPRQLSGGQQQRVAVARAAVFNPRVMLMDEPLGALDKRLRDQLQVEIARLHRELGMTFVYVTHDQEEALALSDRIAVFHEGRIEQVGTAEELYETTATLFVAEFLGESNVFCGTWHAADGLLDGPGYRLPAVPHPGISEPGALVVRPERIQLSPLTSSAGSAGLLEGKVVEVVYLGQARKLVVRVEAGIDVIAREVAGRTTAVGVGDPVAISWDRPAGTLVETPAG